MTKSKAHSPGCKLSTNEKAELLPCPFCGEHVQPLLDLGGYEVICNCGINFAPPMPICESREATAKAWNARAEPQSKAHKICSQCQQVSPLAEFGDDKELIDQFADYLLDSEIVEFVSTGTINIDTDKNIILFQHIKELISLTRNHDKSSRNQVLDEAMDAVKDESIGRCTDSEKEYLDDIIKAIEGLKQ